MSSVFTRPVGLIRRVSWWTMVPWKNGSWQILHSSSGQCLGAGGRSPLVSLPKLLLTRALTLSLGPGGLPRSLPLQLLPCEPEPSSPRADTETHGASTIWRVTSSRNLLLVRSTPSESLCLQRSRSGSGSAAGGTDTGATGARLRLGDCLSSSSSERVDGADLSGATWSPFQVSWIAQVTQVMNKNPLSGARTIQHDTYEHVEALDDASE